MKGILLGLLTGIHLCTYFLIRKIESSAIKAEAFSSAYKLPEMWDRKDELVEKRDLEFLEARGGDPMKNLFHVNANALKPKTAKVRKCEACDWHTRGVPFRIKVANRDYNDHERLQ